MRNQYARLLLANLFLASVSSGCLSTKPQSDFTPSAQAYGEPDANSKLELPPKESARACLAAAQMLEKKGQSREAAFEYEKARANDSSLNKTVCRRLAVLYDRLGDFEKACENTKRPWQSILRTRPCSTMRVIATIATATGHWLKTIFGRPLKSSRTTKRPGSIWE